MRNTNCKGPHTIDTTNVESTRDLISQKNMYRDNRLQGFLRNFLKLIHLAIFGMVYLDNVFRK